MSLQALPSDGRLPELCTFCNRAVQRGRLLACLHNICLRCLREEKGGNSDISCPRCATVTPARAGIAQLLSLPHSYNSPIDVGQNAGQDWAENTTCDECVEEEEATKVCVDCGLVYCEDHAHTHKKSRGTNSHTLLDITNKESGARRKDIVLECSACPLHAATQLELFCLECQELFCKKCHKQGAHSQHADKIVASREAAQKLRQELKSSITNVGNEDASTDCSISASHDVASLRVEDRKVKLQSSLDAVKSSLISLRRRAETVSERVNKVFGLAIDAAKQRQQTLIDDIDKDNWAKQKVLEDQQRQLERALEADEQVDALLARCESDLDFLRMAGWLKQMQTEVGYCLEKNTEPAVAGHVSFKETHIAEVQVLVSKAGKILDIGIDVSKSTVSCQQRISPAEDLDVSVTAVNSEGESVCSALAAEMDFQVSVKPEEGDAVVCEIEPGASPDKLKASLKSPTPGTYHVSVTMGHRHLEGSPLKVEVLGEVPGFYPDQKGDGMELSNDNKTVRLTSSGGSIKGVYSTKSGSQGTLFFRVRIDKIHQSDSQVHLSVSCKDPPETNSYCSTNTYGWNLPSQDSGYGGGRSPVIQEGDVVTVLLDFESTSVTFTLERTGERQIIRSLPAGKYCLYVGLYWKITEGHEPQVTLC
eukprot:scpid95207/ scgid19033/ Tripartite motif-containing protein 45